MECDRFGMGRAALGTALLKLRRYAGTAAAVAVFVPLAVTALTTPAQAVVLVSPLTATVTSTGNGQWSYNYTLINNLDTSISMIELPEANLNEFTGTVSGWTISQTTASGVASLFSGAGAATFKSGLTPQGYLDMTANTTANYIALGTTFSFSLLSAIGQTVSSNAILVYPGNANYVSVDPPSPAPLSQSSVPEPGSLALLSTGLLAFFGLRARRKG